MLTFIFMAVGLLLAVSLLFVAFAFGSRNRGKQNVSPAAKDPNTAQPLDPSTVRAIDQKD